ncbi:PAP-associated domain-containing protein [Plasmodiophora brassicae]
MLSSRSALLAVLVIGACGVTVHAGKRGPVKRGRSRISSPLPWSPSAEIRDAVMLLEEARVTLCQVEAPSPGSPLPKMPPCEKFAAILKGRAPMFNRVPSFKSISMASSGQFSAAYNNLADIWDQIEVVAGDHLDSSAVNGQLDRNRCRVMTLVKELSRVLATLSCGVGSRRDSKFQDIPKLQFWNATNVSREAIVLAALQIRDQSDLAQEFLDASRSRNAVLEQVYAAYDEYCDLVFNALSGPILIAVAEAHNGKRKKQRRQNAVATYSPLIYASHKAKDMKGFIAEHVQQLRLANGRLVEDCERQERIRKLVDQIIYMMQPNTSPTLAESVGVDANQSKKKAKKKKKKAVGKPIANVAETTGDAACEKTGPQVEQAVQCVNISTRVAAAAGAEIDDESCRIPPTPCVVVDQPRSPCTTVGRGNQRSDERSPIPLRSATESGINGTAGGSVDADDLPTTSARSPLTPDSAACAFARGAVTLQTLSPSSSRLSPHSPAYVPASKPAMLGAWLSSSILPPAPPGFDSGRTVSNSCSATLHRVPVDTRAESLDAQLTSDLRGFVAAVEEDRQWDDHYHRQGYGTVLQVVRDLFPDAIVNVAGSVAYGLHLPAPISDLDLVIQHPAVNASDGLRMLYLSIRCARTLSSVKYFPWASTPIIKATAADSLVNIDVTWNVANVEQSRDLVLEAVTHPFFRPIVMYMKYYLHVYGLGSPYHGGIGSFTLYVLVIFHLQANGTSCSVSAGSCLRAFLEYYGSSFQVEQYCISVHTGGRPILKADRGHRAPLDVARLCVDSPFDETVDIGRSAFNFAAVRRQLLSTYTILAEPSAVSLSDLTPHDTPPVHGLTTKTRQTG